MADDGTQVDCLSQICMPNCLSFSNRTKPAGWLARPMPPRPPRTQRRVFGGVNRVRHAIALDAVRPGIMDPDRDLNVFSSSSRPSSRANLILRPAVSQNGAASGICTGPSFSQWPLPLSANQTNYDLTIRLDLRRRCPARWFESLSHYPADGASAGW